MKNKSKTTSISEEIILQWVQGPHWAITLALFRQNQNKKHLLVVIEGESIHPYIEEFNINIKEVKGKNQITKKMTPELWSEINFY